MAVTLLPGSGGIVPREKQGEFPGPIVLLAAPRLAGPPDREDPSGWHRPQAEELVCRHAADYVAIGLAPAMTLRSISR